MKSRYREWRNNVTKDDGILILSALVINRRGIGAAGRGKAILPHVAYPGCEKKKVTLNRDDIWGRPG